MIEDENAPTVSVIVPVYNDPDGIRTTLESLIEQQYPNKKHEILVVDNGSADETPAIIESFAREHSPVVSLSETEIQGSYAARNRGVEYASGSVFAFIDADMWVDSDWIKSIARVATREEYDYFGCNVKIKPVNKPPTLAEKYNMENGFPIAKYIEESHFAPTCCLVTRASVFESVGQFDERLVSSGDKEFGRRVHRNGFAQGFVREITMYHPARDSFSDLRKKAFRVGRGRAQLRAYHEELSFEKSSLLNPKHFAPPLPHRFYRAFCEGGFSNQDLIFLYFYVYSTILSSTAGQIYERLNEVQPLL